MLVVSRLQKVDGTWMNVNMERWWTDNWHGNAHKTRPSETLLTACALYNLQAHSCMFYEQYSRMSRWLCSDRKLFVWSPCTWLRWYGHFLIWVRSNSQGGIIKKKFDRIECIPLSVSLNPLDGRKAVRFRWQGAEIWLGSWSSRIVIEWYVNWLSDRWRQ
jgi:hypothetical protein